MWLVATLVFVMFFVLLPKPARNLAGGKQATPSMIDVRDEWRFVARPRRAT
jgi:hypothetical protein